MHLIATLALVFCISAVNVRALDLCKGASSDAQEEFQWKLNNAPIVVYGTATEVKNQNVTFTVSCTLKGSLSVNKIFLGQPTDVLNVTECHYLAASRNYIVFLESMPGVGAGSTTIYKFANMEEIEINANTAKNFMDDECADEEDEGIEMTMFFANDKLQCNKFTATCNAANKNAILSAACRATVTMGISRDSLHKRRATGGRKKHWRKKKKYEMGRQPANTKLSSHVAVRRVRVRGGNVKFRALRLDHGTFSWGSEAISRKVRILDVVYNASNNELVRTQTLVKSAIIQVDAAPFKAWYQTHYGVELGGKGKEAEVNKLEERKASNNVKRKIKQRLQGRKLDSHLTEQFSSGRLLACIASRPGQSGRCDGYILEGKELEFYIKKLQKKKSGAKA